MTSSSWSAYYPKDRVSSIGAENATNEDSAEFALSFVGDNV
eukprot:CAMPEP_0170513128 /NCGR_PEP_ID=MMETSP0208-20121228/67231_1 /TAXON_ID=197538 /ORGANISM="Strombidium inclinatum, Strain S3" /LENGTH=40 /DNA_ID= /DNA_START= /DNA_END= /DNA_ORIENTATION=